MTEVATGTNTHIYMYKHTCICMLPTLPQDCAMVTDHTLVNCIAYVATGTHSHCHSLCFLDVTGRSMMRSLEGQRTEPATNQLLVIVY